MRLFLLQNMLIVPTFGGANKANRLLLEDLTQRGHECQVIAPAIGGHGSQSLAEFARELTARQIEVRWRSAEAWVLKYNGVEVHAVLNPEHLYRYVPKQAAIFKPDLVIVSSQDPGQLLLKSALEASVAPVIYVVHSVLDLPFGPHAVFTSSAAVQWVHNVSAIITVSAFLKEYLLRWGQLESSVLRFPVYGSGPFSHWGSFENGCVTCVNPCAYKGISIFLKLAELFPLVPFAALPAWGTTEVDRANLTALPNITILEPSDDIDTILARTRILLVPSLWPEAFGIIAVEAMLRGIPVMASNVGGLTEAKLGVDFVLPVRPIECYETTFDSRRSRVPVVPDQDIAPWADALRILLKERRQFEAISKASRAAALSFVSKIDTAEFEEFFQKVARNCALGDQPRNRDREPLDSPDQQQNSRLSQLTPEKRTLLALQAMKTGKTK